MNNEQQTIKNEIKALPNNAYHHSSLLTPHSSLAKDHT